MGWFKRKKKAVEIIETEKLTVSDGKGAGITVEGGVPVGDELTAVLSAAVASYEADSFTAFAGSPAQMELAAVISAAVAAYESGGVNFPYIGTGPSGLYVRKLNRNAGFVPAWGVMGNREAIDARRF
jgi:hypothetical protein